MAYRAIKAFFSQLDFEFIPFAFNGTGTAVLTFGSSDLILIDNGVGDYTLTFKNGRQVGVVLWCIAMGRSDAVPVTVTLHDTGSTTGAIRLKAYTSNTGAVVDVKVSGLVIAKRGAREL